MITRLNLETKINEYMETKLFNFQESYLNNCYVKVGLKWCLVVIFLSFVLFSLYLVIVQCNSYKSWRRFQINRNVSTRKVGGQVWSGSWVGYPGTWPPRKIFFKDTSYFWFPKILIYGLKKGCEKISANYDT